MISKQDYDAQLAKVLNCQKEFGYLVVHVNARVPNAVYCGRGNGSKYGNPYSHKNGTLAAHKTESREESVVMYAFYLKDQIKRGLITKEELAGLAGKRLSCFCSPLLCHCHVLAAAAAYYKKDLGRG